MSCRVLDNLHSYDYFKELTEQTELLTQNVKYSLTDQIVKIWIAL